MIVKRMITVTLAYAVKYDLDFPPEGAIEFAKWLGDLMAQVPPEYAGTAKLEIDTVSSYEDSHYATVAFTYERPETDEETALRLAKEKNAADARRAYELKQLAALKKKYEGGT